MRIYSHIAAGLLTAAVLGLPGGQAAAKMLGAGTGPYSDFYGKIAPGQLVTEKVFDSTTGLRILGARILVQGKVGKDTVVKEIEYTSNKMTHPAIGKSLLSAASTSSTVTSLATVLDPPVACAGGTKEPVLYNTQEGYYTIQWCKDSSYTTGTAAKKNYYYTFSTGDYQLVASVRYVCGTSDEDSMPPAVVVGLPCPQ